MNLVFVVLDTFRKDKMSVYNEEIDFTENLQQFSEDATVFNDAVANAPWTLPSHASMFTGQYPWEHGATQRKLYLETDRKLLAEKFEHEGYTTACFTTNTWLSPYTGMTEGFQDVDNFFGALPSDLMSGRMKGVWKRLNSGKGKWFMEKMIQAGEKLHWLDIGSKKTPKLVEKAENFIENNRDEDFFLFLNFMDCHLPYEPEEEYKQKHAADVDSSKICQKAHAHNGGEETADFDASEKLYNAEVDYLDDQIGGLLEFIQSEDLEEETVFVIVADHGENLGEDNMMGHQFSVSEQLISVPLMVKSPKLAMNEVDIQIELKELYNLVPWFAGIEDEPEYGTGIALGGYQYPELDLKNIPKDKHEELGKRLLFARGDRKKLVRKGHEDPEDKMIDLPSGDKMKIDPEFAKKLDGIDRAESGSTDVEDEEIKERLEDLGYM